MIAGTNPGFGRANAQPTIGSMTAATISPIRPWMVATGIDPRCDPKLHETTAAAAIANPATTPAIRHRNAASPMTCERGPE